MDGAVQIGFVGLGNMGWPMSKRLSQAGHAVRVFDVDQSARDRAVEEGMTAAESGAATADDVDVLILMLPNSRVVESVLIQQGALNGMKRGSVIVDMGSSEPGATRKLAQRANDNGVSYVDAPVSGGVVGAQQGNLTIMAGGTPEAVQRVGPLLDNLGSRVSHVGPAGAGHALKALNNLMSATHLLVSSEALLIGHGFGLDYQVMLDAVNSSSGRSGSTEVKWPKYVLPGSYDSGFGMSLMAKDMGIAVELAEDLGLPAPLGKAATELWRRAAEDLGSGADHTAIVKWLERQPTTRDVVQPDSTIEP